MGGHEGGRWDVAVKDNAVYLQRVSDDNKQLFEDSLASDEARKLAELLTKFADKADASEDSDKPEDSDKSEDSDKDDSDRDDDSDEDDSDKDDDSEKSDDSDKSSD